MENYPPHFAVYDGPLPWYDWFKKNRLVRLGLKQKCINLGKIGKENSDSVDQVDDNLNSKKKCFENATPYCTVNMDVDAAGSRRELITPRPIVRKMFFKYDYTYS